MHPNSQLCVVHSPCPPSDFDPRNPVLLISLSLVEQQPLWSATGLLGCIPSFSGAQRVMCRNITGNPHLLQISAAGFLWWGLALCWCMCSVGIKPKKNMAFYGKQRRNHLTQRGEMKRRPLRWPVWLGRPRCISSAGCVGLTTGASASKL